MVSLCKTRTGGRRILALGTIGLYLCCTSGRANAFCRTKTCGKNCTFDENTCPIEGIPIAWAGSCLSASVQREGSPSISHVELSQATDAAFRAWQEATCPSTGTPPTISVGDVFGPATCSRVEYNPHQANANIIVIRESWEDKSPDALALTTVSYSTITGELFDADIEVNGLQPISAGPVKPNFFDLQSILTHEAGHFLGLAHSNQGLAENCATMCERYSTGTDAFRTLEEDDVAAICTIYPPERKAPACDPSPHMGFSPECGLDPMTGGGCSLAVSPVRSSRGEISALLVAFGVAARRLRRTRQRTQKLA
jgi:hypothetical protein